MPFCGFACTKMKDGAKEMLGVTPLIFFLGGSRQQNKGKVQRLRRATLDHAVLQICLHEIGLTLG